MNKMESCPSFISCSAPLCPLDDDIDLRMWYDDEDVCISQIYGKHRWIKKQRSIVRRRTKTWLDRPVTYKELYSASRKRYISPERLEQMKTNLAKINAKNTH